MHGHLASNSSMFPGVYFSFNVFKHYKSRVLLMVLYMIYEHMNYNENVSLKDFLLI